jgi:hypothetical protein
MRNLDICCNGNYNIVYSKLFIPPPRFPLPGQEYRFISNIDPCKEEVVAKADIFGNTPSSTIYSYRFECTKPNWELFKKPICSGRVRDPTADHGSARSTVL